MGTPANITDKIASVPEERRLGIELVPQMEADASAELRIERRLAEFVKDLDVLKLPSNDSFFQIPPLLRRPSDLSTAFGRMIDEAMFRDKLEAFTEEVGRTKEAEIYLVRWSAFMNAFLDKVFTVRALLEAALAKDDLEFEMVAANEIGKMSRMMESAPIAFQRNVEEELGGTWAFDLVGMQLERINQPMNMVSAYPKLIKKFSGEALKQWRNKTIQELSRLSNPLAYLSGIESYKTYTSSLTIDLRKEEVDLFVSYPKQGLIDLEAVNTNARSFYYLWAMLQEIVLEAGRNRWMETKIRIDYSPTIGAILVKDEKPIFRGALYPFLTEPPQSRLWSLKDKMGPGANLHTKDAKAKNYTFYDDTEMEFTTLGTIVIELPDALAPNRKMTFEEAAKQKVATKINIGGERVVRANNDSEDSDVRPMASLFSEEESEPRPVEIAGIVRETPAASAETYLGDDDFSDLARKMDDEEAAALKAKEIAAHSTTGVLAAVAPALLKS